MSDVTSSSWPSRVVKRKIGLDVGLSLLRLRTRPVTTPGTWTPRARSRRALISSQAPNARFTNPTTKSASGEDVESKEDHLPLTREVRPSFLTMMRRCASMMLGLGGAAEPAQPQPRTLYGCYSRPVPAPRVPRRPDPHPGGDRQRVATRCRRRRPSRPADEARFPTPPYRPGRRGHLCPGHTDEDAVRGTTPICVIHRHSIRLSTCARVCASAARSARPDTTPTGRRRPRALNGPPHSQSHPAGAFSPGRRDG